jgi:hypothetical protein
MTVDSLRNPKALRKIGEMRGAEASWTHIQKTLEKDLGIKASLPTIQNAYNIYAARSSEIIAGDEQLKGALKQAVFDTAERLKKIGKIMDDILDAARTSPDTKISAAKEVLNQLYFQEKLLNRIEQGFDWGKISKIEYTKISINNLEELEKAGYIKILRRPGQGQVIDIDKREAKKENIKEADFNEEEVSMSEVQEQPKSSKDE